MGKVVIYCALCIGCLFLGHIIGYIRGKETADNLIQKILLIFDEDYNLLRAFIGKKEIPLENVSARIESYALPEETNNNQKGKK